MHRQISKVFMIGLCKIGVLLVGGIAVSTDMGAGMNTAARSGTMGTATVAGAYHGHVIIQLLKGFAPRVHGQSAAVQQLLLDVTKLSQFKQLLSDLQTSYEILNKGYSSIKSIATGNFNLHAAFIDGLLLVNPSIARYRRVADIISDELTLVKQYKKAFAYFKNCGRFRSTELNYLGKVYNNLVDKSVDNLDALTTVLTGGKLRMSDDERLTEINRLYKDTHKMLQFLMDFNRRVSGLASKRGELTKELNAYKQMQGLQ